MVSSIQGLAPITNPLNSVLVEKKLINVDQKFIQLVSLAEGLPRTEVIESGRNYWRGVCRSLIFRFPDDLEILKLDVRSYVCLLYTSPSPRDREKSRMPSSA